MIFEMPLKSCGCGVFAGEVCDCAEFAAEAARLFAQPIILPAPGTQAKPSTWPGYAPIDNYRLIDGRLQLVAEAQP